MQLTKNFKLKKIELVDSPPDITVLNFNWDTIDTNLKQALDRANDWNNFKANGGAITGNLTAPRFALEDKGGIGIQGNLSILYGKGEVRLRPSGLGVGNYGVIVDSSTASMCPEVSRQISLGTNSNLWKEVWVGNYNKSLNGYCSLPNGMIMQWGYVNGITAAENTITLPIAMSHNNYNIHVTDYNNTTDGVRTIRVKKATATQFVIVPTSTTNAYWLVIGW